MSTLRRMSITLLVGALATTSACRSDGLGLSGDGGFDAAAFDAARVDAAFRTPLNHRPDDSQCAQPAGPGYCGVTGSLEPNECHSDSDCTAGTNGRCEEPGGPAVCFCSYDTCAHDSDCPSNQLCACHDSALLLGGSTCYPGNCRVDSDCGAHGFCSPSAGMNGCGGLAGYYCHTPEDKCVDDSDCDDPELMACESTGGSWSCQMQLFCA